MGQHNVRYVNLNIKYVLPLLSESLRRQLSNNKKHLNQVLKIQVEEVGLSVWHYKILQARLMYFSLPSYNQTFFQRAGVLLFGGWY